jgi:hypothetical protein
LGTPRKQKLLTRRAGRSEARRSVWSRENEPKGETTTDKGTRAGDAVHAAERRGVDLLTGHGTADIELGQRGARDRLDDVRDFARDRARVERRVELRAGRGAVLQDRLAKAVDRHQPVLATDEERRPPRGTGESTPQPRVVLRRPRRHRARTVAPESSARSL